MKINIDYTDRELYYSSVDLDWRAELPNDNWCLILIANMTQHKLIDEVICESLTRNVGYICGIGKEHDYIHDIADEEYVSREIGISNFDKPKYVVMTSGLLDFEEGLWFGLNLTLTDEVDIIRTHIIDIDCKWKNEIENLIVKFKTGYIPMEE